MYLKKLAAPQNDEVNLMVRTLSSYWREKQQQQKKQTNKRCEIISWHLEWEGEILRNLMSIQKKKEKKERKYPNFGCSGHWNTLPKMDFFFIMTRYQK